MKRLVSLKLLTEKLHTRANYHHFSKPFHTLSRTTISKPNTHQQPWQSPKKYGFFTNHVLAKHFASSTAHFKGPIRSFVGPTAGFARAHSAKVKNASPSASTQKCSGRSSWFQGYFSAENVILGLIVANTVVFILWRNLDRVFMIENFTISVDNITSGRIHTLITNAFSHIGRGHLFYNMIGLLCFGSSIGRIFGPLSLLKLYISGAAVGSMFFLVYHAFFVPMFKQQGTFNNDASKVLGLGASGAVNAIALLYIFLFPKATILVDFFIPVPAVLVGVFLIGNDILRILKGDSQVSGSAHMGGAAVAAAASLQLKRGKRF